MMAGIKSKDTKPEMLVRKTLHRRGFRFRLHQSSLPGRPDLVFPKYCAALFVNGCFWHGHDCHLFKIPKTRTDFWTDKISKNRLRDRRVRSELVRLGFRHKTVWECQLKGKSAEEIESVIDECANWLVRPDGCHP